MGTRIFGGLVAAQIVVAAGRTMAPFARAGDGGRGALVIHAVQQVFLRPGQAHLPIHYRVTPTFTGRTFASAFVEARQDDDVISHAQIGLVNDAAAADPATDRSAPISADPTVTDWVDRDKLRGHTDWRDRPIETRVSAHQERETTPDYDLWVRAAGPVPNDDLLHRALLAYASDRAMINTARRPHVDRGASSSATINHSIWFHRRLDMNQWHLHAMHSPTAADSRAMIFGLIHSEDGRHVASTAQEGMLRFRRPS